MDIAIYNIYNYYNIIFDVSTNKFIALLVHNLLQFINITPIYLLSSPLTLYFLLFFSFALPLLTACSYHTVAQGSLSFTVY